MPHSLTQDKMKRVDEMIRLQNQHDTDIKRLWKYIGQLQAQLRASGIVPVPEA